ncbi:MAG: hypothetical protein ACJ746_06395 [Bryobacteraceae bacterium]
MRLNSLDVTFHRTVRVPEGRAASNLPPSLGRMKLFKVSDFQKNCPHDWAQEACFMALHETEAMWISFRAIGRPCAVLIGAGGVNALTGQKLGTKLETDNYLVCPPQPWIDGWKDVDETVHQFVATPHKKGEGTSVGEQLIGADSKTGAIGLAMFDPKDDVSLTPAISPEEWSGSITGNYMIDSDGPLKSFFASSVFACSTPSQGPGVPQPDFSLSKGSRAKANLLAECSLAGKEMGLGKGGKILQKIYADPHGLEVWRSKPTVVFAFYLVDAKTGAEITGEDIPAPVSYADYGGNWYGLKDENLPDVAGTSAFAGLKSAAFAGDISNAEKEVATELPSD